MTILSRETIRVPGVEFSGMYYPQIVAWLRKYGRIYASEITNEDPRGIFIQLERAFALVGHTNNVMLDMIATECFLPSARLPESIKRLLALINYRMLPASPGKTDLLAEMTRTYATAPIALLDTSRKFATIRTSAEPEIIFENRTAVTLTARTDQTSDIYNMVVDSSGTCSSSSATSDIITNLVPGGFVTADLNKYIRIYSSVLGNYIDEARITELLDEAPAGQWTRARLAMPNGDSVALVSESPLDYDILSQGINLAPALNAGGVIVMFNVAAPVFNDRFYFGHADVMFDRIDIDYTAVALGNEGIVEFFDDNETVVAPDTVTVDDPVAGYMTFVLTSLLGTDKCNGAIVSVTYIPTGVTTNGIVIYGANNYVVISGYLGQTIPSTTESDYKVSAEWRPVSVTTDTTGVGGATLSQDGRIEFDLPQSQTDAWEKYTIYNPTTGTNRSAYYLRYRLTAAVGLVGNNQINTLSMHRGAEYISFEVTQGKTVDDNPLGSSNGTAGQEFTLTRVPVVYNSITCQVDEGGGWITWTGVSTFLTSYGTDRHFVVDYSSDGTALIQFGDGTNGRIPPAGVNNIRAFYRIDADEDGNIGAGTLTENRDGVGVFKSVTNPRAGSYWVEADWASIDSLERAKVKGPLALRAMYRASAPRDYEILATRFTDSTGVKPVARARSYEETMGPKTVEVVIVGTGGSTLSSTHIDEIEEFFNGGDVYEGVGMANTEAVVTNYTPLLVGLNVQVRANSIITEDMVIQKLAAILSPTAVELDRVTYTWEFGQDIPLSKIVSEIFRISAANIHDVVITSPSLDIILGTRELPVFDAASTTITMLPWLF